MRAIAVAFLAVMLTACSTGGTGQPALSTAAYARGEQTAPTTAPSRSSSAHPGDHRRSLTPQERSLATAIAKREQSKVIGTFIGATAFVTQGTPFDRGSDCDVQALPQHQAGLEGGRELHAQSPARRSGRPEEGSLDDRRQEHPSGVRDRSGVSKRCSTASAPARRTASHSL